MYEEASAYGHYVFLHMKPQRGEYFRQGF